jgi:transcriptional regulator with XRE-family HTH domain
MRESFYDHEKVADLRESMNLSKQGMADALGVTLMTVYRIERGGCSLELLAKVAIVLGVPLAALLYRAERIAKNFSPAINIEC